MSSARASRSRPSLLDTSARWRHDPEPGVGIVVRERARSTAARRLRSSRSSRRIVASPVCTEDRRAGRHRRCRRIPRRTRLDRLARSPRSSRRSRRIPATSGWRLKRVSASSSAAPPGAGSIRIRLLSASDSRPSTRSIPRSPCGIRDRRARSSAVQPPAKTPSLANRRRSSPRRSSSLQAIAPRRVRCRSGRSRAPPPRSRLCPRRSQDLRRLSSGCARRRARARAAARPSRSAIARMAAMRLVVEDEARTVLTARSRNSATPASASSGGTGWPRSPLIRSSSRLVDEDPQRRGRRGRCAATARRRRGAAARGCRGRAASSARGGDSRSASSTRSLGGLANARWPPRSSARSAPGPGRRQGRRTMIPCGKRSRTSRASRQREARLAAAAGTGQRDDAARRELVAQAAASSSSRPTKLVTSPGRLVGASVVRSARSSSATPRTTSR